MVLSTNPSFKPSALLRSTHITVALVHRGTTVPYLDIANT